MESGRDDVKGRSRLTSADRDETRHEADEKNMTQSKNPSEEAQIVEGVGKTENPKATKQHVFPKDISDITEFTPSTTFPTFIPNYANIEKSNDEERVSDPVEPNNVPANSDVHSSSGDDRGTVSHNSTVTPFWAPSVDPVSDVNLSLQYLCRNMLDETVILDNTFQREKSGSSTSYQCQCVLVITSCSLDRILDFRARQSEKNSKYLDAHCHRKAFVSSVRSYCKEMTLDDAVAKNQITDVTKCNIQQGLAKIRSDSSQPEAAIPKQKQPIMVYVHKESGGIDKKKREAKKRACQKLLDTLRLWVFKGVTNEMKEKKRVNMNDRHKIELLKGLPNLKPLGNRSKSTPTRPRPAPTQNSSTTWTPDTHDNIYQFRPAPLIGVAEPLHGSKSVLVQSDVGRSDQREDGNASLERYSILLSPAEADFIASQIEQFRSDKGEANKLIIDRCRCVPHWAQGLSHISNEGYMKPIQEAEYLKSHQTGQAERIPSPMGEQTIRYPNNPQPAIPFDVSTPLNMKHPQLLHAGSMGWNHDMIARQQLFQTQAFNNGFLQSKISFNTAATNMITTPISAPNMWRGQQGFPKNQYPLNESSIPAFPPVNKPELLGETEMDGAMHMTYERAMEIDADHANRYKDMQDRIISGNYRFNNHLSMVANGPLSHANTAFYSQQPETVLTMPKNGHAPPSTPPPPAPGGLHLHTQFDPSLRLDGPC